MISYSNSASLFFAAILFLCFVFIQLPIAPHPDGLWLTLCAQRWLEGGSYYHDFIDVNPPASILLHVPALWFSNALKMPVYQTVFYYFSVLVLCSFLLCLTVLYKAKNFTARFIHILSLLSLFAMALALPAIHFGQRDYLLFCCSLPFLLCFILKIFDYKVPLFLDCLCAFWSALFFVLKPHFYVVILGLLAFRFFYKKEVLSIFKDLSLYIIGAVTMIYLASVFLFFPEFINLLLPDVIDIYLEGSIHMRTKLSEYTENAIILIWLIVIGTCFIKKPDIRNLSFGMIGLSLLFLATFWLQNKGFYYHYLPAKILLYANMPVVLAGLLFSYVQDKLAINLSLLFLFSLSLWLFSKNYQPEHSIENYESSEKIAYINQHVASDEYFSILQSAIGSSAPAYFYTEGKWASRFGSLWFMADLLKPYKTGEKITRKFESLYQKYQNMIIEDLERYNPKLIFIPTNGFLHLFLEGYEPFENVLKNYRLYEKKSFPVAKEIYGKSYSITYDVYLRKN